MNKRFKQNQLIFMKDQKPEPTKEEIAIALKEFYENGGIATKLPESKNPARIRVPSKFGSAYEFPFDVPLG